MTKIHDETKTDKQWTEQIEYNISNQKSTHAHKTFVMKKSGHWISYSLTKLKVNFEKIWLVRKIGTMRKNWRKNKFVGSWENNELFWSSQI